MKIEIVGIPAPQGSKRHVGGGRMVEMSKKVGPWREAVRAEVQRAYEASRVQTMTGPVSVSLAFRLPRPYSHFGSGRNYATVRPGAPRYPGKMPDLDKLTRSTLDGLVAGGAIKDDGLVVSITATKDYGVPGCTIIVEEL